MKSKTCDLVQIEREVVAAKRILKEKQAKRAATRNRLTRANAARVIDTVNQSLDSLRRHRHLLEELASGSVKKGRKKTKGMRDKSGRNRVSKSVHAGAKKRPASPRKAGS